MGEGSVASVADDVVFKHSVCLRHVLARIRFSLPLQGLALNAGLGILSGHASACLRWKTKMPRLIAVVGFMGRLHGFVDLHLRSCSGCPLEGCLFHRFASQVM